MRRIWTRYALGVAALALVLASGSASAWECDFLTGGGFIIRDSGAKANFGVGGGCKDGSPTWGHLEYIDHGTDLNVHWTSITAYIEVDSSTDSRGKPTGARRICGTARTNLYGDVDWFVIARDRGEPASLSIRPNSIRITRWAARGPVAATSNSTTPTPRP